jgi:PKD repeat protein
MRGSAPARLGRVIPLIALVALFLVPGFASVRPAPPALPPPSDPVVPAGPDSGPLAAARQSLSEGLGPRPANDPGPTWNLTHPVLTTGAAMAYDSATGEVVLFEGLATSQHNSTWTYDNGNWTQLHLPRNPSVRYGESMVYDPMDQEVVLFGGGSGSPNQFDNDTWVFRSGVWTMLNASTTGAPPARAYASVTYDASRAEVLLFGGTNVSYDGTAAVGVVFRDTWTFSADRWTKLSTTTAPTQRYAASLGYDSATGGDVLFGGLYTHYFPNVTTLRNDTWTFQGGQWSPSHLTAGPSARAAGGFAYDGVDQGLILFGGTVRNNQYFDRDLNDTWLFASGNWTKLTGPEPPVVDGQHPLVAGPGNDSLLLFGSPAWTFGAGSWSVSGPHPTPPPVGAPLLTYDARDRYVILVGSGDEPPLYNVTWSFHDGRWTNLSRGQTTPPPFDTSATMTYDPLDGYVVLFGGETNRTWTFSGGNWTELPAAVEPPARFGASLVFDPAAGYAILFGGSDCYPGYWYDECTWDNDTWGFVHGTWFPVLPTRGVSPPARSYEAMAFDAADGYLLVFGGLECANASACVTGNDTWRFAGGTWSRLATPVAPPPRIGAGITYDDTNGSVVLVGGAGASAYGSYLSPLNGTWTFAGGRWSLLNFSDQFVPSPAIQPGFVYDPEVGQELFLNASSEAWTLQLTPRPTGPLNASISASPVTGDAPLRVLFGAATSGGSPPYSDLWAFGDGSDGTGPSPDHVYNRSGTFHVTLTTIDALDAVSEANATVSVGPALSVTGTLGATSGVAPLADSFQGRTVGGTGPFSALWSFGDGATATTLNASHTYQSPGTFEATLLVADLSGSIVEAGPWNVTVLASAIPLSSSLAVTPAVDPFGTSIQMTTVVTGGLAPFHFAWASLPSGCEGADTANITCRPTAAGSWSPSVTVSDVAGEIASATTLVVVSAAPLRLTLVATPTLVSLGKAVQLVANLTGGVPPTSLTWSSLPPGCPTPGTDSESCVPSGAGQFTVRTIAADSDHQTEWANVTIIVQGAPAVPAAAPTGPWGLLPAELLAVGLVVGAVAAGVAAWTVDRLGRRQS